MNDFWRGKRVFLTGQTGFKGAWLLHMLHRAGAQVYGYALPPASEPSLFALTGPFDTQVAGRIGDIRDPAALNAAVAAAAPDIAIHMAAQALVRYGYAHPSETFETNVVGTVNVLDALTRAGGCKVALVVTSDKVYANDGTGTPFKETDRLGGSDPYSASKACTEIAVSSFRDSYPGPMRIATARAGNVVGGGDWAADRLVPDFIRALERNRPVALRYPDADRPWQHVLDVLWGYLLYVETLWKGESDVPPALNFGPANEHRTSVQEVAERLAVAFGRTDPAWELQPGDHPPEAPSLRLDAGEAARRLNWRPLLDDNAVLGWTAEWYAAWRAGDDPAAIVERQLAEFAARARADG